jgi:hypothetical protein
VNTKDHLRKGSPFFWGCALLFAVVTGCGNDGGAASTAATTASAPGSSGATTAAAPTTAAAGSSAPAASSGPKVEPAASASADPAPPSCPDLASPEKVYAFAWDKSFQVEPALAAKLKGLTGAAAETRALAAEIEGELKAACIGMATLLGAKGPFASADVTCQAAVDALRATRAKLGPAAKINVNVHRPVCPAPFDAMAECAQACGGGDKPEVTCEGGQITGRCADKCDGECALKAAAKCEGSCEGRCDAGFSGTCTGTCKGKCNGAALKAGTCTGKCEGTCEGFGRGTCNGTCQGGCEGKTNACQGLCLGKCSSALQDRQCTTGLAKVASLGPECAAYCGTRDVRKSVCTPAVVNITVKGAKDSAAGTQYEQVIERSLPAILRVEQRLKSRMETLARNQTAVSDGLKAIASGSAPQLPALNPCLLGVEKVMTEGMTTLKDDFRAASLAATIAQGK